ncbi:organic cation transporter protein-like [Ylistrum balloti]|uniref:organic cation transporter protein-like n=1 Tax=Ylistrum balloti TaxID=509963 RepID=UPI0029058EC3|nr:organic cation transporter protein-like [Ylistrum balloti]
MDFDQITTHLGAFGRYQKFMYCLICIASVFSGIFTVISAIILAVPEHRCKIPGYDNDTYEVQNERHQEYIKRYIPTSTDDTQPYDRCHIYAHDDWDNISHPENVTKIRCSSWVYDQNVFKETFTSKHDLVCDSSYKTAMATSLYFTGVLVGANVLGHLSDAFGRKISFIVGVILLIVSTLSLGLSPSYTFFCVCMVLTGGASEGMYTPGLVIGLELVGPSKRTVTGTVTNYFFAVGMVILTGLAYFIRHWKYVEIACAVPTSLFLLYWWLLPESPRWLITNQRYLEAEQILRKAAKVNRVSLREEVFDHKNWIDIKTEKTNKRKFFQLFKSRVLLIRMLIIWLNMCVINMTYYGLTLNTGYLDGDYYLNFFLSALVEFPAYTIPLLLMDRIGRKWLHFVCMIVGGTACFSTMFTILHLDQSYQQVTVALAMLGKLGITAAFSIIIVYSAELFPTVVRSAAISTCSIFKWMGTVVAAYIVKSGNFIDGRFGRVFPMVVFGVVSVVAALLALFLPETMDQDLPETIGDGIRFGTPAYKIKPDTSSVDILADKNVTCSENDDPGTEVSESYKYPE